MKKTFSIGFAKIVRSALVPIVLLPSILSSCDSHYLNVTITSPSDGYTCYFNEPIIFNGNAVTRNSEESVDFNFLWSSSRDGVFGSGQRLVTESLSEGGHRITLTVADSDNNTGSDSIAITVMPRTGLYSRGNDYIGSDYRETIWASVTLRSTSGEYVTGLAHDDFRLTETVVAKADGSAHAHNTIYLSDFLDDVYGTTGFWEASTGGEPLDIVTISDCSGSMGEFIADVRAELSAMVERMIANHVDFRIAAVQFDACELYHGSRFYGPQEPELIQRAINNIPAAHEAWALTWAYDAVLFAPWLGFRDNARKVCLVITDSVPQTAYTSKGLSGSTRTAVELFLEDTGIELYYCQRPGDLNSTVKLLHVNEEINPWAADSESGFQTLTVTGGEPLATKLDWPFSAAELERALGIDAVQSVTDSRYLLAFESSIDRWNAVENSALIYHPDDYELHVTIAVDDPDNPGEQVSATCIYPIQKKQHTINLVVTDEVGFPYSDEVWCDLYYKMDGRQLSAKWQMSPQDGTRQVTHLFPATYNVFIRNSGDGKYRYETLRAIHRETISVTEDGMSFAMQVATADRDAELYKARGLLQDIANWQGIGDPFQDFVDEAAAWLDEIESDGISWNDMAALKRFMVGMSGYANIIRFSQAEAEGAIKDFDTIVGNFRHIVEEVKKIQNNTSTDWEDALASTLMTIVDVLITHGEFTAAKEAIEEGLEKLVTYIAEDLTRDLRRKIIEQFPAGDYSERLTAMVNYLIDAAFSNESAEPDWDGVVSAVQEITLGSAMDAVWDEARDRLLDNFVDRTIRVSIADDVFTKTVKNLIKQILEAFMSDDAGSGIGDALENFARGVGNYVTTYDNATITGTVNGIFDNAAATMQADGVPVDVREFLVGMARELTLLAIPSAVNGQLNYDINTDAVVSVLVKYGVYYVILKDYFIDDIRNGLVRTLADARDFVPAGDWDVDMLLDFPSYHACVHAVEGDAWDALRLQNDITEWAKQLQELCKLLDMISEPLDFIATVYPDLKNTAENVHMLISVLDSFQILANATSFGLKVHSLDTFGNQAMPMAEAVFPVK